MLKGAKPTVAEGDKIAGMEERQVRQACRMAGYAINATRTKLAIPKLMFLLFSYMESSVSIYNKCLYMCTYVYITDSHNYQN